MRSTFAFLLISAVVSLPVHAGSDVIKFEGVQENCVQVGKIKFGANAKWTDCSVTKGRWFATVGFMDMYQAQYCLGKGNGECDQRAFLVFANRAYTPNAKVVLQRFDAGAAKYEDPVLIQTKFGNVLTLTARFPDGSESKSYYRYQSGRWKQVDARAWLQDLSRKLPKGETVNAAVWPDIDTMSAQAPGIAKRIEPTTSGPARLKATKARIFIAHKMQTNYALSNQ